MVVMPWLFVDESAADDAEPAHSIRSCSGSQSTRKKSEAGMSAIGFDERSAILKLNHQPWSIIDGASPAGQVSITVGD
jgi:hypothetical protein